MAYYPSDRMKDQVIFEPDSHQSNDTLSSRYDETSNYYILRPTINISTAPTPYNRTKGKGLCPQTIIARARKLYCARDYIKPENYIIACARDCIVPDIACARELHHCMCPRNALCPILHVPEDCIVPTIACA
ncbi:hypothetical protein KY284_019348 [Solanum tuberosum]|nr:hypothetical protein KY284_019348 [Solanum tuberosum]